MLAYGGGTVALSANQADPVLGTWKLNLAKSKFDPGPAPQSQMRTYAERSGNHAHDQRRRSGRIAALDPGDGQIRWQGLSACGESELVTLSMKRVNGTTVKTTLMRGGKVVGTMMRSVSDHGIVLTVSTKVTDPKGAAHNDVAVFDKQ